MDIELKATSLLPTRYGDFRVHIFTDGEGLEHMALEKNTPAHNALVRLHSECATGDIMGSLRCDCRDQLESALRKISDEGSGLLIYLRGQEGRGIGLVNKIKAYALQDNGMDTVDANLHLGFKVDQRSYVISAAILKHFGLRKIRLLTNNRLKIDALQAAGIEVEPVSLWTASNPHNERYIETKRVRMGHIR